MKISLLDYGACNIESVKSAFYSLGVDNKLISKPEEIKNSEKIVIPGVGAAKTSIDNLKSNNLFQPLKEYINAGKPILGICLGFQLFANKLYENGLSNGFEFLDAEVVSFSNNKKKFHIGWNTININENLEKFFKIKSESSFYFCHSYYLKLKNDKNLFFGKTKFLTNFPSIIVKNNIMGVQFHPEKSQSNGIKILEKFINWKP